MRASSPRWPAAAPACSSAGAPRTTAPRRCGRGRTVLERLGDQPRRRRPARRTDRPAQRVPVLGGRRARGPRTPPREQAAGRRPRRPALGRHRDAAGAAAAGRDRRRTTGCCSSPPGATTRGRPARWPTSPRPWPGSHAVRVELAGLDEPAVAGDRRRGHRAAAVHEQADALRRAHRRQPVLPHRVRPARRSRGPTSQRLLAEDDPPTAVQEVLGARLERLPERHGRGAAGRGGDRAASSTSPLLAAATGDRRGRRCSTGSSPRMAAGLVREDGVDRFAFAHALVRDTIYAGAEPVPPRPPARPGRRRSWRDGTAGRPRRPGTGWPPARRTPPQAWRSAAAAAEVARRAHAHEEAADLLPRGARGDGGTTRRRRHGTGTTC